MAATVVQLADEGNVSLGPIPISAVDITGDNSYPANGYTLTANQLNCGRGVNGLMFMGCNTAAAGYVAFWNTTTGKLQIFESAVQNAAQVPLAEIAPATDVSTFTFRFMAVGQR